MNHDPRTPQLTSDGARRVEAREDRLAKALRENLVKRKAQQRARDTSKAAPASLPAGGERDGEP